MNNQVVYEVVKALSDGGVDKLTAIKIVRDMTGQGLKESKDQVDSIYPAPRLTAGEMRTCIKLLRRLSNERNTPWISDHVTDLVSVLDGFIEQSQTCWPGHSTFQEYTGP